MSLPGSGQGYPTYNMPIAPVLPTGPMLLQPPPMPMAFYPGISAPTTMPPSTETTHQDLTFSKEEEEDSTVEYEVVGTKRVKKGEVELELDKTYNLSDVLTTAILRSQYFKSL